MAQFLIDSSFKERSVRFVRAQYERWPALYLNGEPAASSFDGGWHLEVDPVAKYSDILTFSSGAEMEEFWEEHGYALDQNGEGPFSIFYKYYGSRIGGQVEDLDAEVDDDHLAVA
ncbi:hypothetical protein LN042_35815 [Kitasatospora sp. RB6PN24]|uniref:hypothetical protein n=1 Tax=Kitasatospora humi TaxID=2893891 RepID=UPI001E323210|nr:hypothetical protein [Kitasatospora humi]MCC9312364.1 hypothetical protein [Kitasatospora humi]